MTNRRKWRGKRKRGYPTNSNYFQEFMDELTVKEVRVLSEKLCAFHWTLPRRLVKRYDGALGKDKSVFMNYFPDARPTSGATLLKGRRIETVRCKD